ncbi:CLAVATA3/ESR (CLE)-related protein 26-like isoform X1 [Brassica napus]|uniref:CLAVATA3/ESR (CLE)-related protein 26-like isoform X1 n=1 Tax=Brassica napus TaxID=3708 RepID=UPI0006AAD672|nr:CLAVATA3/ESR (CLE)-related protein 26-like isoform X1 [Brassica napus]
MFLFQQTNEDRTPKKLTRRETMRNLQTLCLPLLFRTLFMVGFVTLLMIDVFVLQNNNEVDKTKEITTAATMNNSIIHAKGVKEDLVDGSKHGDLSYVASKRKVPRGPDPIHNRLFIRFFWPPCTLGTSRIVLL